MTTRTNALLNAAITALVAQVAQAKKAGLETLGLGSEILPGVKFRDLKNWLKENASAHVPTEHKADAKPAAKTPAAKAPVKEPVKPAAKTPAAVEFTTAELKGSALLIGRAKETIKTVVRSPEGVRVAVTESGVRVPVTQIERNNRGNLRTTADYGVKTPAPKAVETAKAVGKAIDKVTAKAAHKPEGRELVSRPSSQLISAIHNRDDKTLTVTFKSGAVYVYENVGIREANAMAKEESHGKYFVAHIKNTKEGKCIVRGKPGTTAAHAEMPAKAPVEKAPVKVVAAPKPTAAAEHLELKATEVRGKTIINGRAKEKAVKVVRNKETGAREVVCESGARFPLALIVHGRGDNLKVAELSTTVPAATPKGGAIKKATAEAKPAAKAPAKEEAPKSNRRASFTVPKISEVRGATFEVNKGSKSKAVTVKKVVTRNDVRLAITENGGELNFDDLSITDGVLAYNGKLMASDFHAL